MNTLLKQIIHKLSFFIKILLNSVFIREMKNFYFTVTLLLDRLFINMLDLLWEVVIAEYTYIISFFKFYYKNYKTTILATSLSSVLILTFYWFIMLENYELFFSFITYFFAATIKLIIFLATSSWEDILNWIFVLAKKLQESSLSLYDVLYGYWAYCRNFLSHENTLEKFDTSTKIVFFQNSFHLFYYSENDYQAFLSKTFGHKSYLKEITCNSIEEFLELNYNLKNVKQIYMCTSLEHNYVFEDNLNRVRVHRILVETRDGKLITINLNDYDGDICHKMFIYFDGSAEWDYLNFKLRYEKPGYKVYVYKETLSSMVELNFKYFSPEDFPTKYSHLFTRSTNDLNKLFTNFKESFNYNIKTFNNLKEFKDKIMFSGNPKFDKNVLVYNMEENQLSALFVSEVEETIYYIKSLSMDGTEEDDKLRFVKAEHDFPFNNNFIVKPLDQHYNVFKDYCFKHDYLFYLEDLKESHQLFFFSEKDWQDFLKRIEYKTSPDLFKNKNILHFPNDKSLKWFFDKMQISFDDMDFGHICYIFINEQEYYAAYVFYQKSHNCFFVVYTDEQILSSSEMNWARRRILNKLIFTNSFENICKKPLKEPNLISFNRAVKSVVGQIPGRFNEAYFFREKSWEMFRDMLIKDYASSKQVLFFPEGYEGLEAYLEENNLKYTDMLVLKGIEAKIYDPIKNKLFSYDIVITKKNVWFVRTDFSEEDRAFYTWLARSYSRKNEIFGYDNDECVENFFNQYFIIVNDSKSCNYFSGILAKQDKFETEDFFYSKYNTINFAKKKYFFQYIYLLSHTNFSEIPVKPVKVINDYKSLMFELRKEGCNFNPTHERFSRFSVVNVVNKSNLITHSFNIIETEDTVFVIPQRRDIRYIIDIAKMISQKTNPDELNSILKNGALNGDFYYYNDCEFCKKTFDSFCKHNFHFQQHYSFYEKDLFFKNTKELLEKIQLLWLHKDNIYSKDSNFSNDVFSKFTPINITPDFFEPAKIVNCSKEYSAKQIEHLEKNYLVKNFSDIESVLESDFNLSPEDKESLEKKNYDCFNEMLTLGYNEKSGVFDISNRLLFIFNKNKTELAAVKIDSSEFDEDIKDTFCCEVYDESPEKKKSYLQNESFIFLKKSKADYFSYGTLNDTLTKEASPEQKQKLIKELRSYIKQKEEDEF